MAKLTWMPAALNDIDKIADYISQYSLQGSEALVITFFQRATVLERFPEIGRMVPELKDSRYRQILAGRYRIIYQLVDDDIFILTVHHQSMLLSNNSVFKSKLRRKKR